MIADPIVLDCGCSLEGDEGFQFMRVCEQHADAIADRTDARQIGSVAEELRRQFDERAA